MFSKNLKNIHPWLQPDLCNFVPVIPLGMFKGASTYQVTPGEGRRGLTKVSLWCHQREGGVEVKYHLTLSEKYPTEGGGGDHQ